MEDNAHIATCKAISDKYADGKLVYNFTLYRYLQISIMFAQKKNFLKCFDILFSIHKSGKLKK